jgi:hypothetical protein
MRSDNKVRELAIMCLPWQQWTETSVWFDDVEISAFHSYIVVVVVVVVVVVELWQSLSEWCLLLSELCFHVQSRECWSLNYSNEQTLNILLNLSKSRRKIREMLVEFYRDNAMKKTAVYKWVTRFSEGRESVTDEERSGQQTLLSDHVCTYL